MPKLKQLGFLNGFRSGNLSWTNNQGEKMGAIDMAVSTLPDDMYIRFSYIQTDRDTDEKKNFNYRNQIVTTPCNYGGVRYWFICGLTVNGKYCGKRVRTLYKNGDYFGCRHCYNLSYDSRNESRHFRSGPFAVLALSDKVEKLQEQIKRPYYAGKPTRKQRRLEKLENRYSYQAMSFMEAESAIMKSLTQRK